MSFREMNGRRAFHSASQPDDVKSLVNTKPFNTVAEMECKRSRVSSVVFTTQKGKYHQH